MNLQLLLLLLLLLLVLVLLLLVVSDGQITNQITSTNHKSFAKMI